MIGSRLAWPIVLLAALVLGGCAGGVQEMAAQKYGLQRQVTLDLGEGVELTAVLIPPGTFTMGGPPGREAARLMAAGSPHPHPPHEVTISKPFYMATTEVTNRQFRRFLADSHYSGAEELELRAPDGERFYSEPPPVEAGKWPDPEQPVVQITWHTAEAFCHWLAARSGRRVRLPTEAQWEYACRAGTSGAFYFGNLLNRPWFEWTRATAEPPLPGGSYRSIEPTKVGYLRNANPWGLYDMLGNVREYCSDWFGVLSADPQVDPTGPAVPASWGRPSPVIRGGTADQPVEPCYDRHFQLRPGYDRYTGFRVCIDTAEPAPASRPSMPDAVYPATTPATEWVLP